MTEYTDAIICSRCGDSIRSNAVYQNGQTFCGKCFSGIIEPECYRVPPDPADKGLPPVQSLVPMPPVNPPLDERKSLSMFCSYCGKDLGTTRHHSPKGYTCESCVLDGRIRIHKKELIEIIQEEKEELKEKVEELKVQNMQLSNKSWELNHNARLHPSIVWNHIAGQVANSDGCKDIKIATSWANDITDEYIKRFPK